MSTWAFLAGTGLIIAGISVVGGIVALLKQSVVVDESGHVTAVEIPLLGRLTTNYPSLVAIFLGLALAAFVINKITPEPDRIKLLADFDTNGVQAGNHIFVGAIPSKYLRSETATVESSHSYSLDVDRKEEYNVIGFTLVRGVEGRPVYLLAQGPARMDEEGKAMIFAGSFNHLIEEN